MSSTRSTVNYKHLLGPLLHGIQAATRQLLTALTHYTSAHCSYRLVRITALMLQCATVHYRKGGLLPGYKWYVHGIHNSTELTTFFLMNWFVSEQSLQAAASGMAQSKSRDWLRQDGLKHDRNCEPLGRTPKTSGTSEPRLTLTGALCLSPPNM